MKHKIWSQHLISAIFAFVLSASAIGNLITGYALPVDSLWKIYLWCALFAFGSAVLFRFRYGGKIILCLAAFALLILWKRESLWQQTQFLAFFISAHYHRVYAWPVLGNPAAKEVSLPLILWATLVAVCVNWHICRRKHILVALLPTIIPLVLCLVTIDKVPSAIYLYLMILGLSVLLLTDWTRSKNPVHGMKLLLRAILPIAVSLALLFLLNPRDGYVNNAGKLKKEVVNWFQDLRNTTESVVSGTPVASPVSEKLNLRTVGPKNKISHSVMRVNSPIGGTLYLRGRDYDQYTGTGWEASSDRSEKFTSGGASVGELSIVTYGIRSVLYVPYYVTEDVTLVGGAWENDENYQRYSFYLSRTGSGNPGTPSSLYTKLPGDTLQWANELAKEITGDTETYREKVIRIQNYVRSCAVYDLSTSRMDAEYDDFAQWFLEESETGYCVHFATATTVLLRAAGIPARYVEGYMVSCSAGSDVIVSNRDAHAWAEYYDSDSGAWRVLEATPADPADEETEPASTIPETENTPEETQAETETSGTEPNDREDLPTKPHNGQKEGPGTSDDSSGRTPEQGKEKEPFQVPEWIKTTFKLLLLASCIPLQGYARIYWKRTLWNRGRPNERTMTRWRQTRSLAKLLKQPYPEELDNLAQKAKFSQHRIQPEELRQFEDYRQSLMEQVHSMPWFYKFIFKWLLAVD